ncbi:hypothetical protein NQ314_013285 [Rhamnusium bicolor]|uniref:Lipase domain-containing protein n=1 Tax=Rhamnusium bicolor TaxID=1586634 RepID=A0AAV8X973_9CUCU|nr:hypothetical protein NQ314_013285 [Rhamnusium bicolor]
MVTCDHQRAPEYFAEAILNPKEFLAKSCSDWDTYKDKKCENGQEIPLGDITAKITGNFYLETNKDKPYARKTDNGLGSKILNLLQQ